MLQPFSRILNNFVSCRSQALELSIDIMVFHSAKSARVFRCNVVKCVLCRMYAKGLLSLWSSKYTLC